MARIVIEKLHKIFKDGKGKPVCAVRELSLTVEDKEFLVLVGPSGSGKTTTLRLMAGLEEVTGGTISIDGRLINPVAAKDREIAMVFQHPALYPHMTAYENMAFGLKLRKLPKPEIEQRVCETAALLGLSPLLARRPPALSAGERQRVSLGRAMVRRPRLFLFDEPLSNLDAPLRAQMRAEISKLHRTSGSTIVYVTHDQVEAMTMGDRIAVMNEGIIQQIGRSTQLYHAPLNLFTARFIGWPTMNVLQGKLAWRGEALQFIEEATAGRFHFCLADADAARLARYAGRGIFVGLRPEHFTTAALAESPKAAGLMTATVEVVERLGSENWLHLAMGVHPLVVVRAPGGEWPEVGDVVAVVPEAGRASFFDPETEAAILG